ncbi:MAG: hypothetical protein U0074_08500 [Kouleothrix sp.]
MQPIAPRVMTEQVQGILAEAADQAEEADRRRQAEGVYRLPG